jgi:hypothetical protein
MASVMASIGSKGKVAWILAMIVGVVLVIVGAAVFHPANVVVIVIGCLLFAIGLLFLIASVASRGVSD